MYHTHETSHTLLTDIQETPCHEQGMPGVCTSSAQNMTLPVIHTAHRATDGRMIKPSGTQADWHSCTSMFCHGIGRCSVAGGSKSCNKVAVGASAARSLWKLAAPPAGPPVGAVCSQPYAMSMYQVM